MISDDSVQVNELNDEPNMWIYRPLNAQQVEDASALYELDSILSAADGVVLSRGNLGLDVAPEKMARVQKSVISACNLMGALCQGVYSNVQRTH
jgi:cobalamin biosynthesis protein CbiD